MAARGAADMTRVHGLDYCLGIRTVVRLDHRDRIVAKDRLWRVRKGIEISTFR